MTIADLARQECTALAGDPALRGRSLLELLTIAFLRGSVLAYADNKRLPLVFAEIGDAAGIPCLLKRQAG